MATLIGSLTVVLTAIMALSSTAVAWNIPGHMLSAAIAYQVLSQESHTTIEKIKAVLEKHPWYVKPMADEAARYSRRRSRPRAVYAGGQMGRRYSHEGQATTPGTVALHQLALQTRGATGERPNQRA